MHGSLDQAGASHSERDRLRIRDVGVRLVGAVIALFADGANSATMPEW